MAEPQTVNCGIIVPNTGDLVGTWGSAALNPDFVAVDGYLGGVQTISASSSPITLTSPGLFTPTPGGGPTQAQNAVLRFTGTLTSNVTVTLPLPGFYIIENLVTGAAFVLLFRAIGAGEVIAVDQGSVQHIYNDGTNVRFVNLPQVGSYMDVAQPTWALPSWLFACTKPPYLLCDGTTFSAVTYPYLSTRLGGTTLPDFRGSGAFFLNGGTGRLTSAGAGIDGNTLSASGGVNGIVISSPTQLPAHTHNNTLNDPGHIHPYNVFFGGGAGGNNSAAITGGSANPSSTGTAPTGVTITNASVGAGANIPNAAPGTVAGIRLIRAA